MSSRASARGDPEAEPARPTSLTVRVHYPGSRLEGANGMICRGRGLGLSWGGPGTPLKRTGDNTWTLHLTSGRRPLRGDTTEVTLKLVLDDGTWQRGPDVVVLAPCGRESQVDLYPFFRAEKGRVVWISGVHSPQLRREVAIAVYLPPSFDENALKKYSNVMVCHDAQNLFEDEMSFSGTAWHVQDTIDHRVFTGECEEFVVIAVGNSDARLDELAPFYDAELNSGGLLNLYLDFIQQTALPVVLASEVLGGRVSMEDRTRVSILGSSMGGLASLYAAWTRSKTYGMCGCLSGSLWWGERALLHVTLSSSRPLLPIRVYIDSGEQGEHRWMDDGKAETIEVKNYLLKHAGFRLNKDLFYYCAENGAHTEVDWGCRFWIPCQVFYGPRVIRAHRVSSRR